MILFTTGGRTGRVRLATPADHEAIHRLNYRTFVEEIPQHAPNPERRLVDRFHEENVYAVYEVDGEVVGMVSARTQRPFSLDQKLGSIDQWLPPGTRPVEIRLLAVDPAHRATRVFVRLVQFITAHFMNAGYSVGVLSGTTRQLRLYQHLGCVPFGPLVGQEGALYQPMYVTRDTVTSWSAAMVPGGNFLTGPVEVRPDVRTAFSQPPHSHRSADFHRRYAEVQSRLCSLTNSRHATLLLGSGTLANDVVGAQLLQLDGRGVVVSNGEFGDRLADHAARLGLPHDVVRAPWGQAVDFDAVDAAMINSRARWLWAVHTETSTGVVNDLDLLRTLAQRHRARLALDTVSSVGAIPVNLEGVFMASAVSGKALAAYPGVAIVMHEDAPLPPHVRVPRYLDLAFAVKHGGVPFTQSSNLLDALHASLDATPWSARIAQRARDGAQLRHALTQLGLAVLAPREVASPAVHTIPLPPSVVAQSVGERLREAGWHVGFESDYLRRHNWLQLCLFGEYSPSALEALPRAVASAIGDSGMARMPSSAAATNRHAEALSGA
jgi:aspartate aminotransferase-like enzyme/predicted N-acetyltransferase YhbS